jgi:uncharacterized Zn-finger protein
MKIFICEKCLYKTEYKWRMKEHLNRKTPCKPVECSFDLTEDMKNKILKGHIVNLKLYSCTCGKSFSRPYNLRRHQKNCKHNLQKSKIMFTIFLMSS